LNSPKIPVSVVIFTKNEERNIEACIKSASAFEEIVVLDSNSTDKTLDIVMSLGVRVVNFSWNGKYPKKRQWSLEFLELNHDWVFFLDADERITEILEGELRNIFEKYELNFAAAEVKVDYFFGGKRLKFGIKPRKIALMKRMCAKYVQLADEEITGMGELEGHFQPAISGRVIALRNSIEHNDNDPLLDWFARHIRYAEWESKIMSNVEMRQKILNNKSFISRTFHLTPGKPFLFFLICYFFCLGFMDGRAGLRYALAKAWYYWIVDLNRSRG
jgi:glycosyltransferase involved in cell wall biosynthesis